MNTYDIPTIEHSDHLAKIHAFAIENYYWHSRIQPRTWGRIAYLKNKGFLIQMLTDSEPFPALYKNHQEPVYKDSAMECFLSFNPNSQNRAYFNIEINSHGAVLAGYGSDRLHRLPLTMDHIHRLDVQVVPNNPGWSVTFLLPIDLIQHYVKGLNPHDKDVTFNFYKICETESHLHFGSLAPLTSETPNFHLPDSFIKASF